MQKYFPKIISECFVNNKILSVNSIDGGCINQSFLVELDDEKKYFVKINDIKQKDNFIQEQFNLDYLKNKSSLKVPDVIKIFEHQNQVALVLEYIEKSVENNEFHFLFGKGLAELHQNTEAFFGWFQNNYIGSLKQLNKKISDWDEFFTTQRLEPLVKECFDKNMLSKSDVRAFENLYNELKNIFPDEPPALLHGDLWTGNRMNTTQGAAIFDPACYFGCREMDIAMLHLFGNVPTSFFDGYNTVYSLEKNFRDRIDICNLYPLLVHAVLFGNSYIYDIKRIIKKFQ